MVVAAAASAGASGDASANGDGNASDPGQPAISGPAAQAPQTPDASAAVFAMATPGVSGVPNQAAVVTPQTISGLAAGIVQNVKGKSTRFQLALEPAGLGRVDISVRIGSDGSITAALSFNSPQAADALKAHAGELRDALQQAGFNLSGSDLSFTAGGSNQQSAQGQGQGQGQSQTPAYAAAPAAAEPPPQTPSLAASSPTDGLDIRI